MNVQDAHRCLAASSGRRHRLLILENIAVVVYLGVSILLFGNFAQIWLSRHAQVRLIVLDVDRCLTATGSADEAPLAQMALDVSP